MFMKEACSTLIFDLDGTISDPSLGIVRCANHALSSCGFPTAEPERVQNLIGPPLDTLFRSLTPGLSDTDVTKLVAVYRERYSEVGYSENELYPDIVTTIARLSESGLRLGVCTSKRADFAQRILELFEIQRYFSFIDGGDVGITKGTQLQRLKECGEIDERAIMVGDRAVDIVAASTNSLSSIGVLWGFGDRAELEQESPWQIVSYPGDLLPLVA